MKKRKIGRLLFWLLLLVVVISATGVTVAMNLAEEKMDKIGRASCRERV